MAIWNTFLGSRKADRQLVVSPTHRNAFLGLVHGGLMVAPLKVFLQFVEPRLPWVAGQFDVEAALRRHLVRQMTDKLAATRSN
jgi:hypothetical protein